MKVLDAETAPTQYYNVLLYGPPGTGKTTFGVTAPGPVLFALSEGQGYFHIKQACARTGVPMPTVLHMESISEYGALSKALHGGMGALLPPDSDDLGSITVNGTTVPRPRTLVLDSFTDAGKMLVAHMETKHPAKLDQDGLPTKKFNWWGALGDHVRGMIRAFRDAPCHVIFLCELDDKTTGDDEKAKRSIQPVMPMRATVRDLAHAVNVVGVTYRTLTPKKDDAGQRIVDYGVMTTGPQYMVTKPLRPLRDIEEPDFNSWVQRLDGEVVDVHSLALPEEHLEGLAPDQDDQTNDQDQKDKES